MRCGELPLGLCLRQLHFSLKEQGTMLDILCLLSLLLLAVVGRVVLIVGGELIVKMENTK